MCASRWPAVWPQLVAISLITVAAAGCSDSGRFSGLFGSDSSSRNTETTGSIAQRAPTGRVDSRPLGQVASQDNGMSGGGRGLGSYQPGSGEITGSLPPAPPPPPKWTWEGGTPVTVARGETLETIARRHNVPAEAILRANNLSSAASVHAGMHLVIPRFHPSGAAEAAPPATRTASVAPPTAGMHVVAPGETLNSIARLYGKSVMALAKANNIPPDKMVKVGEHIIIPDVRSAPRARAETPPGPAAVATVESPHSARVATSAPPAAAPTSPLKTAEPAGELPSFRWPVRGRVIAGFGPQPNGLQNDGIDLAVPAGTPVKAAEDGVVAYAGSELRGYGNLVLIRHANGFVTAYAHASEILVKRGETVKRGQVIARSGQTGNVTSPELHFEVRKGASPVDPTQFLGGA